MSVPLQKKCYQASREILFLKEGNYGVKLNEDLEVSVLAYADDLVFLSENEEDLQKLLDVVFNWCRRWRVCINIEKTKIMHFRKLNVPCSENIFKLGKETVQYIDKYKYLGVYFSETRKFDYAITSLAESAGRALGAIIGKCKYNRDMGYKAYSKDDTGFS